MIYDTQTGELIVAFNTYTHNAQKNQNNVAYEVLENGTFSSDSKQNTPTYVTITALKSIPAKNANPFVSPTDVKETLDKLASGETLVNLILQPQQRLIDQGGESFWFMCGNIYRNYSLYDLSFEQRPDKLHYEFNMIFQEIRMTGIEFGTAQIVANPNNTAPVEAGQVQPVKEQSLLRKGFGEVGSK
jgi:hypothetical protein